ncbi:unnamed protein product, partial [Onchocerca ochengi]
NNDNSGDDYNDHNDEGKNNNDGDNYDINSDDIVVDIGDTDT